MTTVDGVTTETTTEGNETMTMTEETTTTDTMRGWVTELRMLAPSTAEVRRLWSRFDAVAGVAWLEDDVLATYSANKGKRIPVDRDRPNMMLGIEHDGFAWWTDSYRLHREGSGRDWQVPAVRGDEAGVLHLDEWLSGPELAEVVRAGAPTTVAPTRDAIHELRRMLVDQYGKAAGALMQLEAACDTQAPAVGRLLSGADDRGDVQMFFTRMVPNAPEDLAILESADGAVVAAVNVAYLAAFRGDAVVWAVDGLKPLRFTVDGETVGLLMPVRSRGVEYAATADCDGDVLFGGAVRDMVDARVWNGKKMLQADPRVFELLRKLDAMAPR